MRRLARAEAAASGEKFSPGVIALTDNRTGNVFLFWVSENGVVHRLVFGQLVTDPELAHAARDAARQAGLTRILRPVPGR